MATSVTAANLKEKLEAAALNFQAGVTGEPKLPKAAEGLAPLLQLIALARASTGGKIDALPAPPEQLRAAVKRLVEISCARDARGDRARAAWRKLAEGGLELIRALNDDPAPNDCT
jgi:hypothetical protein